MTLYYLTGGIIDPKYTIINITTDQIQDIYSEFVETYGTNVKCVYFKTPTYQVIHSNLCEHLKSWSDNNKIFQITDASLSNIIKDKYRLSPNILSHLSPNTNDGEEDGEEENEEEDEEENDDSDRESDRDSNES
jgi:hypothetical protein